MAFVTDAPPGLATDNAQSPEATAARAEVLRLKTLDLAKA